MAAKVVEEVAGIRRHSHRLGLMAVVGDPCLLLVRQAGSRVEFSGVEPKATVLLEIRIGAAKEVAGAPSRLVAT